MDGLRRLRSSKESVEPVRISLQRFLIFRQGLLRTTHFEQHVSQHFPRGQLDFALSLGVLPVGNRTQQAQCLFVFSFGKCQPSACFVAARIHVFSDVCFFSFASSFDHRFVLRDRGACRSRIPQISRAGNSTSPFPSASCRSATGRNRRSASSFFPSANASQARASSRPVSMYLATYASFPLRVASIIASYCVIAARAAAASLRCPAPIARAQ